MVLALALVELEMAMCTFLENYSRERNMKYCTCQKETGMLVMIFINYFNGMYSKVFYPWFGNNTLLWLVEAVENIDCFSLIWVWVQVLSVMVLHKQGNSCCHTSILVRNTSKDYMIFLNGTGNDKVIIYFLKLHETQAFIYEVLLMYCLIVWQNIVVTYTKSFSLMNFFISPDPQCICSVSAYNSITKVVESYTTYAGSA